MASTRVSAINKGPAVDGRRAVEEPDSAGQAERDRYFQAKMAEERAANSGGGGQMAQRPAAAALSNTELIDRFLANPKNKGPARGVMAELKRIDPSGLRQCSLRIEQRCSALGWTLEHLGATIGTVIHGPDLRQPQSDEAIDAMYALLLERKVIFFRDQDIDYAQHRDFGLRFGSLEVFPFADPPDGDFQEILPIRSGPAAPTSANGWHSDVTWRKSPSLGSMLYCEQAPPFGGATGFADTYCTLQGLPLETRDSLRGMTCIHDFDNFRYSQGRAGVSPETVEELRSSYPVADHPMVRTHPDTGGEMLYVNAGFGKWVEGLEPLQSDMLLKELYAQAEMSEYQCYFKYEAGSLAFWDNRSCMHRAFSDSYPHARRMRRVTIQGSEPYYDPASRCEFSDAVSVSAKSRPLPTSKL